MSGSGLGPVRVEQLGLDAVERGTERDLADRDELARQQPGAPQPVVERHAPALVVGLVGIGIVVARQAELLSRQTRRLAALDITDAYERLKTHTLRAATLMRAMDAAGQSYQLQTEDYRRNLTNNLEVLQSLQDFQDARRNFIRSYYETKRQYWRLQVAIGETL